jgi:protein-tyrosine phosphatase
VPAAANDPPSPVDWIPAADFADGRVGRVGMTVLPGKRGRSVRYPGRVYRANLDVDLHALRDGAVVRLILLVTDRELERWGDAGIVERGSAIGVPVQRHPMPDGSPPRDRAAVEAILASIAAAREAGDVAVACMGGVGRTGTVVACALVAAGWDPDAAIARVRQVRHPAAVETTAQREFVRSFYATRQPASASVAP